VSGRGRLTGAVVLTALLGLAMIWRASAGRHTFAGTPIVVSVQGDLATTLDPTNLTVLASLERRITSLSGVRTVSGPGTLIVQSAQDVNRVISRDLAALHPSGPAAQRKQLSGLLVRYGYVGLPSIDNESFVGQLIFGSGTRPKQRFAWLFPDDTHTLVVVRPRAGLSEARTRSLQNEIKWLVRAAPLEGVQATL
jgi:predicted RND superfamily exporter protein